MFRNILCMQTKSYLTNTINTWNKQVLRNYDRSTDDRRTDSVIGKLSL